MFRDGHFVGFNAIIQIGKSEICHRGLHHLVAGQVSLEFGCIRASIRCYVCHCGCQLQIIAVVRPDFGDYERLVSRTNRCVSD
jgi:hypothetical protein